MADVMTRSAWASIGAGKASSGQAVRMNRRHAPAALRLVLRLQRRGHRGKAATPDPAPDGDGKNNSGLEILGAARGADRQTGLDRAVARGNGRRLPLTEGCHPNGG